MLIAIHGIGATRTLLSCAAPPLPPALIRVRMCFPQDFRLWQAIADAMMPPRSRSGASVPCSGHAAQPLRAIQWPASPLSCPRPLCICRSTSGHRCACQPVRPDSVSILPGVPLCTGVRPILSRSRTLCCDCGGVHDFFDVRSWHTVLRTPELPPDYRTEAAGTPSTWRWASSCRVVPAWYLSLLEAGLHVHGFQEGGRHPHDGQASRLPSRMGAPEAEERLGRGP